MLNKDYKEMLPYLVDEDVKFLLMDAYALAAHSYSGKTHNFSTVAALADGGSDLGNTPSFSWFISNGLPYLPGIQ